MAFRLGPLLAETYETGKFDPTGWWMSEKYDGLRCLWDHQNKGFLSRNGNPFSAPRWFLEKLPPVPLDGELWLGRGRFEDASSVARSASDKGWADMHFMVIDIPMREAGTFEERQEVLKYLESQGMGERVQVITHAQCTGPAMLEKTMDFVIENGGEGLMLRRPLSLYEHRRSPTLFKYTRRITAEAEVVAHERGEGGCTGMLGALWCVLPNGIKFKVGTGFSMADRKNPPPVGCTITFTYKNLTATGKPRSASFIRVRPPE